LRADVDPRRRGAVSPGSPRHADLHRGLGRGEAPGSRPGRHAPNCGELSGMVVTEISPAWEAALVRFRRELQTRGASRHTLKAYGTDLAELAEWASERGREPGTLAYRDLRGYAASLSER